MSCYSNSWDNQKTDKIPKAEIEKAKTIMKQYFEQKSKK